MLVDEISKKSAELAVALEEVKKRESQVIARDNDSRKESIRLQQWQSTLDSKQADVNRKEQQNKEKAYSLHMSIFSKTFCKTSLIKEYGKKYWLELIPKMYELGEELTDILDRNTAWIENCDSKTSIILGSFGVIAGIFLATDYVSKLKSIFCHMTSNVSFWSIVYLVFCIFALGLILAGCVCWIIVLFARVNSDDFSDRGIRSESLVFFSSIAKHKTLSSYKQNLEKCEARQINDDLISQIYICSIICDKKFKYYKRGLLLTSIGSVLFVTLFIIGLAF